MRSPNQQDLGELVLLLPEMWVVFSSGLMFVHLSVQRHAGPLQHHQLGEEIIAFLFHGRHRDAQALLRALSALQRVVTALLHHLLRLLILTQGEEHSPQPEHGPDSL